MYLLNLKMNKKNVLKKIKLLLLKEPIICNPDFEKEFKKALDAIKNNLNLILFQCEIMNERLMHLHL